MTAAKLPELYVDNDNTIRVKDVFRSDNGEELTGPGKSQVFDLLGAQVGADIPLSNQGGGIWLGQMAKAFGLEDGRSYRLRSEISGNGEYLSITEFRAVSRGPDDT